MNDSKRTPTATTIGAILVVIAVVAVGGPLLMGGQVSSILSNVGNSIGGGNFGSDFGGGGDTTGNDTSGGDTAGGTTTDPQAGDEIDGKTVETVETAPELLIIRTGELEIEVGDLDAAVSAARSRVVAVGGYISGSDQSADGGEAAAAVTFRVPADRWDDALTAVRGLATGTRKLHVETEAVTNQVIDLGARITNLRATEAAFQKIMSQATKISDILDVQHQLTAVRGEIERLVAEQAHLEEQAAYGTLTVRFVLPATPVVEEVKAGWDPAADADAAAGTLIKIGQRGASFGIWVAIVGVPLALGVIVLVVFALVARRLLWRRGASAGEA
jgi:Flp pilus assembly pilin Flp